MTYPNTYNKVLSSKTVIMTAVPRPEMTCLACPHHRSEINYIQDRRKLPFQKLLGSSILVLIDVPPFHLSLLFALLLNMLNIQIHYQAEKDIT